MKRIIELKHVRAKAHVRTLLNELIDRLEEKLQHFESETITVHALFEENGAHKLFRAALTCHLPRHMVAAHEEDRDPGAAIREAFRELERQLEKQKAIARHEHLMRRSKRRRPEAGPLSLGTAWLVVAAFGLAALSARAEEPGRVGTPSPQAEALIKQLGSEDAYQQQMAFIRLEALREPATLPAITPYLEHRDPDTRAYAVRALGAIGGASEVPTLLRILRTDRHPRVRRTALLTLEPFEQANPEIRPAFLKALRDRSPEVRMTAVDIVSRLDDPQAREAVQLRYKRERHRDVRRVLDEAITRVGAP